MKCTAGLSARGCRGPWLDWDPISFVWKRSLGLETQHMKPVASARAAVTEAMLQMMFLFDDKPYDYHASCSNSRYRNANSDRYKPASILRSGRSRVGFCSGFRGGIRIPSGDLFCVRRIKE